MHVYDTGHIHSTTVCAAFAQGAGARVVPPTALLPGPIAIYGRLRGNADILRAAQLDGRDWYYIDRGYLRATRDGDYSGYFRVTRNALQHDGAGDAPADRLEALRISLQPWRTDGAHVLVCPPGDVYARLGGFSAEEWTLQTVRKLQEATDRPIRVRRKAAAKTTPLAADLAGCWALVAHSTNAAVEALVAGVPVFCTAPCAARAMGRADLADIEDPLLPDRERWLRVLAANQWTLDEMRSGLAWRMLNA